jgi:hypothetical protein
MIREIQSDLSNPRQMAMDTVRRIGEVRMSVAIQAEWRCILNALTIPEYMDVWLKMPGVETGECPPEQKLSESFCMEIFPSGATQRTVYVACIRTKADEITYLWEKNCIGDGAKSLVRVRLRRGPRRCSLHLKHEGLQDQQERDWYSTMWHISLNRLREMMEKRNTQK